MNDRYHVHIAAAGLITGQPAAGAFRISPAQYESLLGGHELHNLDRISRIALAAAALVLGERKTNSAKDETPGCGLILGTEYGVLNSIHNFDLTAVEKGALSVNPRLFPSTVLNAPACQVEIALAITGPVYTVCNGINSGLDAVGLGYLLVKSGMTDAVLAGAADEESELVPLIRPPVLPVGEAGGFLALAGTPATEPKKPEITGYRTTGFSPGDNIKLRRMARETVRELLAAAGTSPDLVDHMGWTTFLPYTEGLALLGEVGRELGYTGSIECAAVDWMGAGGVVETVCAVRALQRKERGGVTLIAGLDRDRISAILLQ